MKKQIVFTIFMVMARLLLANSQVFPFQENQTYHGFKLLEKRFVAEVNAECLYFMHEQSGARLIKIAADDPNKLFNIAFNTLPANSTGVAHIMEHAVLNGSKSFPVKSPFDVLRKGSLNTFLNAMTGPDFTTYPVASMNDKDYFNLMHVYLDATLFPRIYDDERIFLQEGWHYELDAIDADVVFKGVVFNEMKGAYSSPMRELYFRTNQTLFPNTTYGYCSGGYPSEIPNLTYEAFLDFHRTYYHPSNSFITLYGNANLEEELAFINKNYLSKFDKSDAKIELPFQEPFSAMKELESPYAVAEDSNTEDNTFFMLSFVTGQGTNQEQNMALRVLANALVNHQSAPLRLALQEAGIGKNISAGLRTGKQNQFLILLQNANLSDKDRFREIVFSTMEEVVEKGFDKAMLEGIINREEFSLRESNSADKGITYVMSAYVNWMFANDPFGGLEFEGPLAYVKRSLEEPLLENIIREQLVNNSHGALVALYPQPGLENINNAKEREKLAAFKASLSPEELESLVEKTKGLREFQLREDSPEALATIPMLSLEDISPDISWYTLQHKKVVDVPVYHYADFTNDILYAYMYFDLRKLPQDLLPYAQLLSAVIRQLGTVEKSFGELDNAFNIHTGSFWTYLDSQLKNQSDNDLLPFFVASGKATMEKADKFFELAAEVITSYNLEDRERLKTVMTRHQAGVESQVLNNGLDFATIRSNASFSNKWAYEEITRGLTYYQFITELTQNFDSRSDEIIFNLKRTADLLFNRNNLSVQITCTDDNYPVFVKGFDSFIAKLPEANPPQQSWSLGLLPANDGILSASKVQYVVQGYDFKKLGYAFDGRMWVLSQILSTDYLQNRIRVMGGAYGGFSTIDNSGIFNFSSYRDPNLRETLTNFQGMVQFLENFQADETEMTRFIIGTIARIDRPRNPQIKGQFALLRFYENVTPEDLLAERQAILNTTAEEIRSFKTMISDILNKNAYCVYGNEEKIKENEDLFRTLVKATK